MRSTICIAAGLLLAAATTLAGPIEWQTGAAEIPNQTPAEIEATLQALAAQSPEQDVRRIVVQFDRPVGPALRAELAANGLQLLSYLGQQAFFASISSQTLNASALAATGALVGIDTIRPEWKLHPVFDAGIIPEWAQVDTQPDGTLIVAAYLLFHPDASLDQGIALLQSYGAEVRSVLESVNGLVIHLHEDLIPVLAQEDAVQWLEPPLPAFEPVNAENRAVSGADIAQAPPYDLDGAGVTVLVYDGGTARATHVDFQGRVSVLDSSGMHYHSTHVAGTVGGAGIANPTHKGMAPAVTILSYGFEMEGGLQEGFLYSDPGDIEDDYSEAINTYNADIANNSIGTNTASNGFPCDWEGNYGVTAALIDTIVRGDGSNLLFTEPFRIVWANGNERGNGRCGTTYHTTAPPACAKNHITVGALNEDESMSYFSSWGPADDDRMKPDVSTVGVDVTSCDDDNDTDYTTLSGTSMASPTTCGCSALLIQDYRNQFPGEPDPLNSTLKAFLAHSAVDLGNTGPDYQFGYGSIRINQAVDFMRTEGFLEAEVDQGTTHSVLVVVEAGDPELKVTVAWDDYPGTPNVDPALINDLDLRVYSPSAVRHYPWTLGGLANPSAPADQTQENHVDNIEQVLVENPEVGVWTVEVYGYDVPQGPQLFSLTASPLLVACSPAGVVAFDSLLYTCSSAAGVKVVDCDLNADDGIAETVTVSVHSDSEPGGESLLLTETAANTADFRGTIQLSDTDAPGVLQVAHGDTLIATYVDADDGQGGTNVEVTDTALADCMPPAISNVEAIDVQPRSATITFDTDELARATVYYGLSCDDLTETVAGSGFSTAPSINLSGLDDNYTYFYAVQAEDEAGNIVIDDNGGACYWFTTPDVPDFFTELFDASDNDISNVTLVFTPSGTNDFYAACADLAPQLPTDPNDATTLSLGDSTYQSVSLTGGQEVHLYGVAYSTFYVGSNGYITFGSGDTDSTESFEDHFDLPRISALFDDLDPGSGGTVSWKQLPDRVAVTFLNVPEDNIGGSNTFQIQLFVDGQITITYLDISASDGLVGLSEGTGLDPNFLETNLSGVGNCGPRPPIAGYVSVETQVSQPVSITLQATDDGLPDPPAALSYVITSLPQHGDLTDPTGGHVVTETDLPYTLADHGSVVGYDPYPYYAGMDAFQFRANDGGVAPEGGDSNTATVSITVGIPVLAYSFPMDEDPGWIPDPNSLWAWGQPTGGGGEHGGPDPTSGHTGSYVYGYNLDGDYENYLPPTHLTTTAIDCSDRADVSLKFWRWLGLEVFLYDHGSISVSNDGANWTTLWENELEVADSSWVYQEFDISDVADYQPTVYVRWTMGRTDANWTYCGWNIDDVDIWGVPLGGAPHSLGDLNCDGSVNGLDIDAFVMVLTGTPPDYAEYYTVYPECDHMLADCDENGSVNGLDIDPFVNVLTGR